MQGLNVRFPMPPDVHPETIKSVFSATMATRYHTLKGISWDMLVSQKEKPNPVSRVHFRIVYIMILISHFPLGELLYMASAAHIRR